MLFDLDGTLADTAPDLAWALNTLRQEQGLPPLPFAAIRPVVSHGANALLQTGFGLTPEEPGHTALRQRYLALYRDNICRKTRLFPGMAALLDFIEGHGKNWGVVTNKPAFLTQPLLAALGLTARAACIISGDSLPQRKPHPAPLLAGCAQAGSTPCQCLYVGDARRDIQAGRAAGMATAVALFGYLDPADAPADWGADVLADSAAALKSYLAGGQ
ncbi:MAG TPA: phosphoglycolate phosphatase [Gammaproteobacteria bacterium]|nr:phosphoglycolate phosphatase [Gammaproteobacteria bacterium]